MKRNIKRNIKAVIGLILIVAGIVGGLYVGLWWGLIGGIAGVIEAFKNDIDSMGMALNVARVIFAGVLGWGTAIICWGLGWAFIE